MLIIVIILYIVSLNFPSGPVVKNLPAMQRLQEMQVLSGSGRFPGGGHGSPFQYSFLENPLDRGVWQATVHRVTKSRTLLK